MRRLPFSAYSVRSAIDLATSAIGVYIAAPFAACGVLLKSDVELEAAAAVPSWYVAPPFRARA